MSTQQELNRAWVADRNEDWSSDLRQASLVGELEIDDDDLERAEKLFGNILRMNPPEIVARHDPAFFLVAMTSAGMRSWEEGTFYSKVAGTLNVSQEKAKLATRSYQDCLGRFRLPSFSDIGLRWVTPVLLHGTVPLQDLDDLLEMLSARRRLDRTLTGESFVEWARLNAGRLVHQPKAMMRFLQHGGDFAADFVGRVLDLVDGEDVRLPRRVTTHLRELLADGPVMTQRVREVRPSIALTLDGDIVTRLPPVEPERDRSVEWRVHLGDVVITRHVDVPWQVGRTTTPGATVSVNGPQREIIVDRDETSAVIPFVRAEDPLLVFDADGALVPASRPVPPGKASLMWPRKASNAAPRARDGSTPTWTEKSVPYGWDGWTLVEADLDAGDGLRFEGGPLHRVAGANQARVLVGASVSGLYTEDGREFTATVPTVELPADARPGDWTITVSDALGQKLEQISPTARRVEVLADRSAFVGDIEIAVRGPLGRGVTRRVAVAADLSVVSAPSHRALVQSGGLESAAVRIERGGNEVAHVQLEIHQVNERVTLDGFRGLVVEPLHVEYSLVEDGSPGAWTSQPLTLTRSVLAEAVLRVRGLLDADRARLVFRSGDTTQLCPGGTPRRGVVEFRLAALKDIVESVGSGVILLRTDVTALVATVRPNRLTDRMDHAHGIVTLEPLVSEPLELVLHRCAAPWEPGKVVPLVDNQARLPEAFVDRGSLRATVRVVNEWFDLPADDFPRIGVDTASIALLWDAALEDPDVRAIARALVEAPPEPSDPITDLTMARSFEMLSPRHDVAPHARRSVTALLTQNPRRAIEGILRTSASTPDITLALVESGLVAASVADFGSSGQVEALLARSPLAAVLTGSASLGVNDTSKDELEAHLSLELGDDFTTLRSGTLDDSKLGRFEPEYAKIPERVAMMYNFLDPVPARMLDPDTRIEAVYEMWTARSRLTRTAEGALPTINTARRIILAEVPTLWPMVEGRLTHDGVIALPALSIALAIVARIAAWNGGAARGLLQAKHTDYTTMARHAPSLIAIDLVRADAAVMGAHR